MYTTTMHTTVFEYGYLTAEASAKTEIGAALISRSAFDYLKEVCLGAQQQALGQCFRLLKRSGYELIQVQNYVGVILTPTGEQIEVLPKIGRKTADLQTAVIQSREILLMMLQHLKSFRHLTTEQANVASKQMPLLEVFIRQFLLSVNQLLKQGLKSDYVPQVDNLNFQKGKLLMNQQLKHNSINRHKFYVAYDEYLSNTPANRLIKTALERVHPRIKLASNQKLLQELTFAFADIPASHAIGNDWQALKLDRSMQAYQAPLAWVKLILEQLSPLSMKGAHKALSLLFPMEMVFESYVASMLRQQLTADATLTTQASSQYLVTHNGKKQFQLKPDLLITASDGKQTVLDTKWKLLDIEAYHYGISQQDLYQMFAYGHQYLSGQGELYLIYPAHEQFKQPIEHSFDFNENLKLWIVPFVFDLKGKSRVIWP